MKAVEVFINGQRVCLAGVGESGVLSAIVNWVGGRGEDDIFLSVGGLDRGSDEHLRWQVPTIGVGAEVLVRILEAVAVDPPAERVRYEKKTCADEYRQHLRECSACLTPDERRQLLRELIDQLQAEDAEPGAAADGRAR